jgi:hypothetical protein
MLSPYFGDLSEFYSIVGSDASMSEAKYVRRRAIEAWCTWCV